MCSNTKVNKDTGEMQLFSQVYPKVLRGETAHAH